MHKVWVTRTLPGALKTATKLRERGFDPLVAPLLDVAPSPNMPPPLPQEAVLLLTSKNGLDALIGRTKLRHWPVVTVGDATASAAQAFGFGQVVSASGTSVELVDCVRKLFPQDKRHFIHISGENVRGDISGKLCALGYNAERHIYYATRPVNIAPDFDFGGVETVLVYSPMAASALSALDVDLSAIQAVSISAETDTALGDKVFLARKVAECPTEASMFSMLA